MNRRVGVLRKFPNSGPPVTGRFLVDHSCEGRIDMGIMSVIRTAFSYARLTVHSVELNGFKSRPLAYKRLSSTLIIF